MPKTYTATEVKEIVRECLGEREESHVKTLYALSLMWNQYCGGIDGHKFMYAGEHASEVLMSYNLLSPKSGKEINGMCGNAEVKYDLYRDENLFIDTINKASLRSLALERLEKRLADKK